jgi:ribosomal protein L39E
MARNKEPAKKLRLIAKGKVRSAPRWADIKKFGLKRARTRRIRVRTRQWRRSRLKV